jgi:hypothetical protein
MSDPDPVMHQLARRHRAKGLELLKRFQEVLAVQMKHSDSDHAPNGYPPGDIHGTMTCIEQQLMPLLISAGQCYMAACWASNESFSPSVWPCEDHRTPGKWPRHHDNTVGSQNCGACRHETGARNKEQR